MGPLDFGLPRIDVAPAIPLQILRFWLSRKRGIWRPLDNGFTPVDFERCSRFAPQEVELSVQVSQCLRIVELLVAHPTGLPLRDIATGVGMSKSGAHRLLLALSANGYVVQEEATQNYLLSTKLALLGLQYSGQHVKNRLILPVLERLATACGELVQITMASGDALYWVTGVQGAGPGLRFELDTPGSKALMTSTAVGQAWLSTLSDEEALRIALTNGFGELSRLGPNAPRSIEQLQKCLDDARRRGFAKVQDSAQIGVAAVACPIFSTSQDRAIGTLGVAGPSARLSDAQLVELGDMVISEAPKLSEAFSYVFVTATSARMPVPTALSA